MQIAYLVLRGTGVFLALFAGLISLPVNGQTPSKNLLVEKKLESDYFLYLNIEKKNNFSTNSTSIFEFSSDQKMIWHKRGNNIHKKKPYRDFAFSLETNELDTIYRWIERSHFPDHFSKYFKALRNRPLVTVYFESPKNEILIQWEGSRPPKKKLIHKLIRLREELLGLIERKVSALKKN